MKGYLTAIALRLSATDSIRGLKKLTELLFPFPKGFPPGLAVAGAPSTLPPIPMPSATMEDKKAEGFVWGVPKRRRSIETRLTRKFGVLEWHWKLIKPKYNLLVCDTCGHHYEAKHLCRNCYEKTMEETKLIRESMEAKFGHSPMDKDVIVLYESDKQSVPTDTTPSLNASNKLIVELPKNRPTFFSPNLLQKSTAGANRKVKDVTATDPVPIVHKTPSE
ncbi:39S ribosomal protein L32, mitochondrial [Orchesella cincta]|uniref:Large ribosomal subunit protein bL32m n=1 Tax=Orchesella cincta TaxID=48709 RepID=A0A1D2MA33_ORCCI|nr:39S ribosomal protein L32, mitochondrial [Orchesella cincta]